ncbi:uncharacterized protein LOC129748587 [Uranotaenia lowii]|uniref:uncharacterized protein LOC129748587 n=1 Tax=Uranotaenia lowii TaxID=190385 RepID=UPI00247AA8B0|nr:uncharacterized protein LOC129748587 [Uranotaenia lowii]
MKFVLYSGLCLAFASVTLAAVSKPQAAQLETTFKAFEKCAFQVGNILDNNEKPIRKLAGSSVAKLCEEVGESVVVLNETIYGAWDELMAVSNDAQAAALGANVKTLSDATCKLGTDLAAALKTKSLTNFKTATAGYIKSAGLAGNTLVSNLNKMNNVDAKNVSDVIVDLVKIVGKIRKALSI